MKVLLDGRRVGNRCCLLFREQSLLHKKRIEQANNIARIISSPRLCDGIAHRIVRKRKPTLEEEAEEKGWMLLK